MIPCKLSQPITASQLIQQAKARLQQGWTKEQYARDAHGAKVKPCDPSAVCWCLRGAVTRAYYDLTGHQPHLLLSTNPLLKPLKKVRHALTLVVEELFGGHDVVIVNDEYLLHPQEAVAIIERAERYLP